MVELEGLTSQGLSLEQRERIFSLSQEKIGRLYRRCRNVV